MSELFLRKTGHGFSPADEGSVAEWRKLKMGEVRRATVTKPRNYRHHCLFMVLLEKTFENQEQFTDFRAFRRAVAFEAGHCEEFMTVYGEIFRIPLSYSYEELPDEEDFTKEFGAAMAVCARILRMANAEDLRQEVIKYAAVEYGVAA